MFLLGRGWRRSTWGCRPHRAASLQLAPTGSVSLTNSMAFIQNPVEVCNQVFALIENLTTQIQKRLEDPKSAGEQLGWEERVWGRAWTPASGDQRALQTGICSPEALDRGLGEARLKLEESGQA